MGNKNLTKKNGIIINMVKTCGKAVYMILFMISLPLSIFLWLVSSAGLRQDLYFNLLWLRTSPISWLIRIYVPIATAARYHQLRLLNFSGAVSSFILGFIHILTSTCFFLSFFVYLFIATTSITYRTKSKYRNGAVGGIVIILYSY